MLLKNKNFFLSLLCLSLCFASGLVKPTRAFAEETLITEDLLPTESVFPLLDSEDMVMNRQLNHTHRFEVKADLLIALDELFNDNKLLGITAYYHLNNDLGFGLKYYQYPAAFNSYKQQFDTKGVFIDRAPQPKSIFAASLVNRILYGKISVSKDLILPLTLEAQYDLGINKYGTQSLPYSAFSLSNKLYLQRKYIIDLSYTLQLHQVINPVSADIRQASPVPDESAFTKKIQFSQCLSIGLGYLF